MNIQQAEAELSKLRDHITTKPSTIGGRKMFEAIQTVLQERELLKEVLRKIQ